MARDAMSPLEEPCDATGEGEMDRLRERACIFAKALSAPAVKAQEGAGVNAAGHWENLEVGVVSVGYSVAWTALPPGQAPLESRL